MNDYVNVSLENPVSGHKIHETVRGIANTYIEGEYIYDSTGGQGIGQVNIAPHLNFVVAAQYRDGSHGVFVPGILYSKLMVGRCEWSRRHHRRYSPFSSPQKALEEFAEKLRKALNEI